MKRYELLTAIGLTMAALPGCGGGGYLPGGGTGGGGGNGNLSSAPGDSALEAYVQASHAATLKGSDTMGNSWTLNYNSTANAGSSTFNGTPNAHSTTDTITLLKNGTTFTSGTSTSYFLLGPYVPLGKVAMSGTPYAVVATSSPLPTTVTVGTSSAAFDTLTYYHDQNKTTVDADETVTYSVAANNSTSVLLCFVSTIANVSTQGITDGMANGTETDCYTVDASGTAKISTITVTAGGTTIKFQ